MPNINKFSWPQMLANNDGKTSGSGTIGVLCGFVGCLTFVAGSVDYFVSNDSTIMQNSLALIGIAAALLGARKIVSRKELPATDVENTETEASES